MPHHSRKFTWPFIFFFPIAKQALLLQLEKKPCLSSETFWCGEGLSASLSLSRSAHFPLLTADLGFTAGQGFKSEWEDWDGNFALATVN